MKVFTQQMVDSDLQLRRARLPGVRDVEVSDRPAQEERLQGGARHRRHSDRVDRDVGLGQAGDRARLRHRRHSAGVAEAGRRLSRSDDRRRARTRRGPQLRPGREHHRRDRGEEDHGAREAVRARSRSGRASPKNWSARKAYFVRAGVFKDVDVALFTHVGNNLSVSWGDRVGTGLVSVEYTFKARARTRRARRGAAAARSTPSS